MDEQELISAAKAVIGEGEDVLAAGVFGLQDDYGTLAVAGVAAGTAATVVDANALGAGMALGLATHLARKENAAKAGVTVRMLVAVTPTAIHIMDWSNTAHATQAFMRFDRENTVVQVTKFGLSRHLNLADDQAGTRIGLTGSNAGFSPEAAGDKLVLHLMADPS